MILYEDERILALNKPSGMHSVPHSLEESGTAVHAALKHCPALQGIGARELEPGLLHRLDAGTSGVLLFAKTQAEFDRLRALWKSPSVTKTYRAIVSGDAPLGEYRLTLAHSAKSSKRMLVEPKHQNLIRGNLLPTLTRITAVSGHDVTLEIETGVMHQIRASLAHLGAPILGDEIYRGEAASRLMLHAWKLLLTCASGEPLTIEAPLPHEWQGDAEFLADFEACRTPKSVWTHSAHIRLAWLQRGPGALDKIRSGIQRYNLSLGNKTGYHETITCAYAAIVHARPAQSDWFSFARENLDLFDRENPTTLRYYSRERLMSDEARARFVPPDLQPLPG
ncbi:MAG: RluA family pseudouridine synthase [Bdellovibrionota bacterium]